MTSKKVLPILLPLSWLFLLVIVYCQIQHIVESRMPVQIGYALVGVFYGIRYWNKNTVRYTDTIKCVLVVFWCFLQASFASGILFDPIVFYGFFAFGAVWFISEVIDLLKKRTRGHRLVLLLGGMLMGLQLVMRIFHYPGASIVMILAYLAVTLGFLLELVLLLKSKRT